MKTESKAIVCGALAVCCWSTVATAFKLALRHFNNYEMLLVASATAAVLFFVVCLIIGKLPQLARLSLRQWLSCILLGAINPVAYYLALFKAYSLLPAQVAQPINYAWPIALLVLLSVFGGKPISKSKYLGMFMSLCGVAVISFGTGLVGAHSLSGIGIALALFSAVLWAVYWLLNNKLGTNIDPVIALLIGFVFGTAVLGAGCLFTPVHLGNAAGLAASVYVGLFEIGVPFILFGMALRLTSNPALINQMCYLSPFLSLVVIWLVLRESILPTTYVGLLLIVGGIAFNSRKEVEAVKDGN